MVLDINNKEITVGSYVRYINTGTTGKVIDFKKENDNTVWIVLDNELMYLPNYLEVIKYKEHNKVNKDKEYIKKIEDNEELSDIELDMDAAGAG